MTQSPSHAHFETQLAVVRALAESATLDEAFVRIIEAICATAQWEWGALWQVDPASETLYCAQVAHVPGVEVREFETISRKTRFTRGVGLPGRVWASGAAAWITDVQHDDNFPRRPAATRVGLHAALGFPIIRRGAVLAVLEFFTREIRPPDDVLLTLLAVTGEQIGQFIHRQRAEESHLASEARLRAVVNTALDCIVSMDERGNVVEWNPAAEATFGFTREHALGREMAELIIPPALREMHRKGLARHLATGEGPVIGRRIEITACRADGTEFPVELAITRVPASGPAMFTGYIRDITQRTQAERERAKLLENERTARQDAEAANRMKDQFLATVSHELRTPLNAILGWTELLQTGGHDPADIEKGLGVVQRNGRAMAQLVDDVLDVSRIIQGKLRLDVRPVDLAHVIDAAIASIQPAADAKQISLVVAHAPASSLIMGDAGRLQQVVWNLLANAIKFTPRGGIVQVTLERIESHVELTITDNGEGISADFLPQLFTRFAQADSTPARMHGGLGLGLALVRHLVEMHGGTVRAHSDGAGKGATFTIRLPIVATRQADAALSTFRSDDRNAGSSRPQFNPVLRGVRVLLVDDEPDARKLVSIVLSRAGAEIVAAASAAEALELLRHDVPHVLLSDIGMPAQDGYELIRLVRQLSPEHGGRVPAAALTAFARAEDRRSALNAGYQLHIAKPVDAAELIAVVANLAGRANQPA